MRPVSLVILAVLTAGAVAAASWAVMERERATSVADVPDLLFPGLLDRVNDVARVDVATPALRFSIVKGEGESWTVPERGGYPVRFETVKQSVVGIAGLKPMEAKTARADLHEKLQLRVPGDGGRGTMLLLKDAEGTEIGGVVIGKTKSTGTSTRAGWHYVRKSDEDQSWLAAGRVEVFEKIDRWLDSDMPVIKRQRVHKVRSVDPNGDVIEISRADPNGRDFKVDNLEAGWQMIHDTAANALGSAVGFLNFEDVEPAGDTVLENPIVVDYTTFDGMVLTVRVVLQNGIYRGRFQARFDENAIALDGLTEDQSAEMKSVDEVKAEVERINSRFAPWIYRLPSYKGKDFATARDDVVMRKEGEG